MNKFVSLAISSVLLSGAVVAQNPAEKKQPEAKIKVYGFARSYFTFDTRETKSGSADLYNYVPLDESIQADGTDITAHPTFKWSAVTSRLGVDVKGYEVGNVSVGAKFETDFYSGLSGVTGTAQLRLRQAYATLKWKADSATNRSLLMKIGQAWHPMAVDMPHTTALEVGVPFGPFSRTPQITFDYSLSKKLMLTASALWQMQYTSGGPEGASANYMKYSNIPEGYFGLTYSTGKGFLGRVGVDVLSIKPRYKGNVVDIIAGDTTKYTGFVSDRITTVSPFMYVQYVKDKFSIKAKTIYAQAGEHMNLIGGYGVTEKNTGVGEDGSWEYTPMKNSSSWLSLSYGKKWQGILLLGYAKNLGTAEKLYVDKVIDGVELANAKNNYLSKNTYSNINSVYRIAPAVLYNLGKLTVSFEWQITSAQYGNYVVDGDVSYVNASNGLAENNLHWVTNHRLQTMFKYSF